MVQHSRESKHPNDIVTFNLNENCGVLYVTIGNTCSWHSVDWTLL
jgi:hypothetical protein